LEIQRIPSTNDFYNSLPPSGTFYDPNHSTPTIRLQSLGVLEHWNNSVKRKYSRNLGTGNGIELVFIDNITSGIKSVSHITTKDATYAMHTLSKPVMIEFSVPGNEIVVLKLFDNRGRKINTILDKFTIAGNYQIDLLSGLPQNRGLAAESYVVTLSCKKDGRSKVVASSVVKLF
jgi:hypothetical protein